MFNAYHGMIQSAELSSGETVLIHAGHTPIGQAAIAFALHIGSTVFTTVREIVHKVFLMKRFPSLKEKNIMSLESSFAISLMRATGGKGADVVMNCLRGTSGKSDFEREREFETEFETVKELKTKRVFETERLFEMEGK
ncbi:unnamed protein product, partial [Timema podura]|nr:unnamed protein product [Timema podura]